jgi:peptidoglycan/LPS O-acetylase OafA/YrhL
MSDPIPTNDDWTRRSRGTEVVWGVALIALGLMFFADRQGWAWGWHLGFSRLWPLLLIVMGLPRLIASEPDPAWSGGSGQPEARRYVLGSGFWMVLIGVLMMLHVNQVLYLSQSWPLFIVGVGVGMVFGGDRHRGRRRRVS